MEAAGGGAGVKVYEQVISASLQAFLQARSVLAQFLLQLLKMPMQSRGWAGRVETLAQRDLQVSFSALPSERMHCSMHCMILPLCANSSGEAASEVRMKPAAARAMNPARLMIFKKRIDMGILPLAILDRKIIAQGEWPPECPIRNVNADLLSR
jgi:hypothetical protein